MNWSNACNQGFVLGVSKMVAIACHFWFGLHIDDDLVVRLFQWAYDKSDTGLSLSIWSRAPGIPSVERCLDPKTIPNSSVQWNQVFGCLELFWDIDDPASSRFCLMRLTMFDPNFERESVWRPKNRTPVQRELSFPMKMAIARWNQPYFIIFSGTNRHQKRHQKP